MEREGCSPLWWAKEQYLEDAQGSATGTEEDPVLEKFGTESECPIAREEEETAFLASKTKCNEEDTKRKLGLQIIRGVSQAVFQQPEWGGQELHGELKRHDLPTHGTEEEKRERLVTHLTKPIACEHERSGSIGESIELAKRREEAMDSMNDALRGMASSAFDALAMESKKREEKKLLGDANRRLSLALAEKQYELCKASVLEKYLSIQRLLTEKGASSSKGILDFVHAKILRLVEEEDEAIQSIAEMR